MSRISISEFFAGALVQQVRSATADGPKPAGKFRFNVTGKRGGSWTLDTTGDGAVLPKHRGEVDATITVSDESFEAVINEELAITDAVTDGRFRIEGNSQLVWRLMRILDVV